MPKHVLATKDCATLYVVCDFSWFKRSTEDELIEMHDVRSFKMQK